MRSVVGDGVDHAVALCEKVHKNEKMANLIILNPSLQDILHENIYRVARGVRRVCFAVLFVEGRHDESAQNLE